MALLASFTPLLRQAINKFPASQNPRPISLNFQNPNTKSPSSSARIFIFRRRAQSRLRSTVTCHVCTDEPLKLDRSSLTISEAFSEDELWAASSLRARSFYAGNQDSFGIQDHMRYLAEREFEALKERIAGKRAGFGRVSCINATIPLSQMSNPSDDLCSVYQYSDNGEDRVVIGTLDLNQCPRLPDEIAGKRPEGTGSDLVRAYLGNVCVAKELHRNGIAYSLVVQSKKVAVEWDLVPFLGDNILPIPLPPPVDSVLSLTDMIEGVLDGHVSFSPSGICDLYVHVAVDNEPAKKLYMKSGFIYENEEPAWQARFLDRPRRILLWTGLYST